MGGASQRPTKARTLVSASELRTTESSRGSFPVTLVTAVTVSLCPNVAAAGLADPSVTASRAHLAASA